MSLYLALGIGGLGVKHKVTLDKAIPDHSIELDQKDHNRYRVSIPVSMGWRYVTSNKKWQIKSDLSISALWLGKYKDYGHMKVSLGYCINDRMTLSGILGAGLGKVEALRVKDRDGHLFELQSSQLDGQGFLQKNIFAGAELQIKMSARCYGTMAGHICLPFFNAKSLSDCSIVVLEDIKNPRGDAVLHPKNERFQTTGGANIAMPIMGRVMMGVMYAIGG